MFKILNIILIMEVPVFSKGSVIYHVLVNVTSDEHDKILRYRWYKLRGRPIARGIGDLFRHVANLRLVHENLFPDMLPVEAFGKIVGYALVDGDDMIDLRRHVWSIDKEGYAYFYNSILGRPIYMHRYIMDFPEGLVIDHVFWNRLDNRRRYLKVCTSCENNRNGTGGRMFGRMINHVS